MTTTVNALSYRQVGKRLFVRSAMSDVSDARAPQFVRSADSVNFGEDTNVFGSGLPGGVAPVFAGNGSRIANPELVVVFWGPYWPGSGVLNQAALTSAFNTIVTSPYLSGLAQYGYAGPVSVRPPITILSPPNITLPTLNTGVQQSTTVYNAALALVESLVNNDTIGGTDDNHDLIVMVVIDPIVPRHSSTSWPHIRRMRVLASHAARSRTAHHRVRGRLMSGGCLVSRSRLI